MIEFDVQLHCTFGGTKLCPIEQLQAEVNSGCIDNVERVFESELMLWRKRLTLGQHPFEDKFKKLMGAMSIGIGEG